MAGGIAIGALLGAALGALSIRYQVDQIIGGTVINIFALGVTSYLTARVLVEYPDLNQPGSFRPFGIPLLEDIPILGPLLFDNTIYVYVMFLLVGGLTWALFRTPLGPAAPVGGRAPAGRRHRRHQRAAHPLPGRDRWAGRSPGSPARGSRSTRSAGSTRT